MVMSGGVNIYPAEIERVLVEHPGVVDCAVIGVPHDELGETPLALVEPSDHAAPPSIDDLADHCRRRLAGYKCPAPSRSSPRSNGRRWASQKRRLRAPYWPEGRTIAGELRQRAGGVMTSPVNWLTYTFHG